jgi:hypothetical protein
LHVEQRTYPDLPLESLKSVACVTSPNLYEYKSCSGWSDGGTRWYGHEILPRNEMTLLARQLAQEINYTFYANARQDQKDRGDKGYFPGRFRACHAEAQLMAYIYYNRHQGLMACDNSFDIRTFPRAVCDHCHDFAKHIFLAKGLRFNFYFKEQCDLPKCKYCEQTIQMGYLCPRSDCAWSQFLASTKSLNHAAGELAQSLEDFKKALKWLEDEILSKSENQELRQLAIVFKSLRRATTDLRRAVIEFTETSTQAVQKLEST